MLSIRWFLSGFAFLVDVKAFNLLGNFIHTMLLLHSPRSRFVLFNIRSWCCLPDSDGSVFRSRGIGLTCWWKPHTVHRTVMSLVASLSSDKDDTISKPKTQREAFCLILEEPYASKVYQALHSCDDKKEEALTRESGFDYKWKAKTLWKWSQMLRELLTNLFARVEIKDSDPHILSTSNKLFTRLWLQGSRFNVTGHVITLH